jgi:hypothetical protein
LVYRLPVTQVLFRKLLMIGRRHHQLRSRDYAIPSEKSRYVALYHPVRRRRWPEWHADRPAI